MKTKTKAVWTGTKDDYESLLAARQALPTIPRREIAIPSPRIVDQPRANGHRETLATRMASHYQPWPEAQQEMAMQTMLEQVDQREGLKCGSVLMEAKRRLTRDRLAVVEEAIAAYR